MDPKLYREALAREGMTGVCRRGWLTQVPPDFRDAFLMLAQWREAVPGEILVHAGDRHGGMAGIARGTAEVLIGGGPPDMGNLHFHDSGVWFGYMPLLGQGRTVTVTARTQVLWALVPEVALLRLLDARPHWWRHIAELVATELAEAMAAGADMALREPARRIAAVLLRLGHCRHADLPAGETAEVRITQHELARMAASTRSTVNALLRGFEAAGAIRTGYGGIVLADPARLRAPL